VVINEPCRFIVGSKVLFVDSIVLTIVDVMILKLIFIPGVIDVLCRFVVGWIVDVLVFELVFIPVVIDALCKFVDDSILLLVDSTVIERCCLDI